MYGMLILGDYLGQSLMQIINARMLKQEALKLFKSYKISARQNPFSFLKMALNC
jgi:hypothetical protein